jgi:hypothetical protein
MTGGKSEEEGMRLVCSEIEIEIEIEIDIEIEIELEVESWSWSWSWSWKNQVVESWTKVRILGWEYQQPGRGSTAGTPP